MTTLRAPATFGALLLAACAGGCGNTLMATPVGFDAAGGDPFAHTPAALQTTSVRVFVASNRSTATGPDADVPARHFTNERSQHLHLGTMEVRMGTPGVDWPTLAAVSREERRAQDPPIALEKLEDYGALWSGPTELDPDPLLEPAITERFTREVNAAVAASRDGELYLFVHGFNTTVEDNAAVAAGMFHYLGREGAWVNFEWPSRGSVFAYTTDKNAAAASVRTFRQFISHVARRTDAKRIHILAHSAGAPVAVEALHELRMMPSAESAAKVRDIYRLGRLVLVAPDMDLGEFRDAVYDGTTQVPERVTLYVNSRDKALDIASWITGFARLGQPLGVLTPRQVEFLEADANVDLVDVAGAENRFGSWLGHSYFHEDPWVATDVLLALSTARRPIDRGLHMEGNRKVFHFGHAYPERARVAAAGAEAVPPAAPIAAPAPAPATEHP
jgi:hypothetical protein